jgi:CxxC motif-containing protein (DUF1111 family)
MSASRVVHKRSEEVPKDDQPIRLRVALNLLGDGYVEAVSSHDLEAIASSQEIQTHSVIHGQVPFVTLPDSQTKVAGRFGWKAQHGSLLSAAADALNNELGVPNRYFPQQQELDSTEAVDSAKSADEELIALLKFLRSTEPIAPDPERSATASTQAGSKLFDKIGCSICHVRTLKTAPAGTSIDGGSDTVSERLGNKEIHPYSDFLLHDLGTGDGIVQNIRPLDYDESTANKFRTAPLWGVRYRSWLMHDGKSITYHQAIMRHAGEASGVIQNYLNLIPIEKEQLRLFLNSL